MTVAIVPSCIFLVLVPYSVIAGWNGLTLFIFWFLLCPALTLYLNALLLRKSYRIWKALISMVAFYGFMVFMIYKHFATDFFAVMMISFFMECADYRSRHVG